MSPQKHQPTIRGPRCPICGAATDAATRPFCSRRCRDVDLARWLGGGYVIGGNPDGDEDGDDAALPPAGERQDEGGSGGR